MGGRNSSHFATSGAGIARCPRGQSRGTSFSERCWRRCSQGFYDPAEFPGSPSSGVFPPLLSETEGGLGSSEGSLFGKGSERICLPSGSRGGRSRSSSWLKRDEPQHAVAFPAVSGQRVCGRVCGEWTRAAGVQSCRCLFRTRA